MLTRLQTAAAAGVVAVIALAAEAATDIGPMATVKSASDRIVEVLRLSIPAVLNS